MADQEAGRPGEDVTVPVVIDAIRDFDGSPMARCSYFIVETSETSPSWTLDLTEVRIPFVLAGLSAVITRPNDRDSIFGTPAAIDSIYELIESNPTFSIHTSDFWLPTFTLTDAGVPTDIDRGQVFRVGYPLFELGRAFVSEQLAQEEFLERAAALSDQASPSPREAAAFREWSRQQIEAAREGYPKDPDLVLEWK